MEYVEIKQEAVYENLPYDINVIFGVNGRFPPPPPFSSSFEKSRESYIPALLYQFFFVYKE